MKCLLNHNGNHQSNHFPVEAWSEASALLWGPFFNQSSHFHFFDYFHFSNFYHKITGYLLSLDIFSHYIIFIFIYKTILEFLKITIWCSWYCCALLSWGEEVQSASEQGIIWARARNIGEVTVRQWKDTWSSQSASRKKRSKTATMHSWPRRVLKRSYWDPCGWETSDL